MNWSDSEYVQPFFPFHNCGKLTSQLFREYIFLPPANEVWGKVIFSQSSVILLTGGVCLSACWDTPPCQGDPPPGRPPSCQGDPPANETPLPTRPPCQGETPLQGDPPSRPTPRGEIEGDQVQAHSQGGN